MKRILTILLVLCSIAGFSQTQGIGGPNTVLEIKGTQITDSQFYPTRRDTFWTPSHGEGAITYWQSNRNFFGFQNGHWQVFALGNSTSFEPIITPSNLPKQYWNGYKNFANLNSDSVSEGSSNLFFTNARARLAITLTTTGSSGAATYNNVSGVLNIPQYSGAGGLTSVGLTLPSIFGSSNNPLVSNGAIVVTLANQNANTGFFGPPSGGAAAPTFRAMTIGDLPIGIPNANLANSNLNFSIGNTGVAPNFQASSVNLGATVVLNLPNSSSTVTGPLTNTDWTTFNNKVTSVNGLFGVVVTKNADSIKKLPIDTTSNRNGYVLSFDSLNHKWYLAANAGGGGGGAMTIGAFDGNGAAANGLSVSGSSIFAQSASVTVPGMVNTSTQSFIGNKTFTGQFNLTGLTNKSFVSTDSVLVRDPAGKVWTEVFPVRSVTGNFPISVATGLTTPVISADTTKGVSSLVTYYQLTHLGIDTTFIAYRGTGDTLMRASNDSIYSPRFIDSAGFHHYFKLDGTLVMYATGGSGGGATTATITCTACGFSVGKVVSKNATTWVLADTISNYPDAVVSQVIDANTFVVTFAGPMTWTSGLTVGTPYFQSTVAGGLIAASPVISIPVGKPISSSIFNVAIERGFNFTSSGGSASIPPNRGTGFRIYSPQVPAFNSIVAGTNVTIDSVSNVGSLTISATGGGSGATTKTILCTACGFTVGKVVSKNSSTWVLADTISNYPNGVISQVIDADHFVVTTSGPMPWVAHGKTIGADQFLSTTAGNVTTTSPIVSIPIFKAIATDTILVAIQRGFNFSSTNIALTTNHIFIGNGSNIAVDAPSTGDVGYTFSAGNAVSLIANNVVTNAKLAQMPQHTFKANNTGSTANAIDITATQLTAEINVFTTSLSGAVPAPGSATGKILSDNGTWVVNAAAVSSVSNADGTLTISPTNGAVVASLNLAHANTWGGTQTFTLAPVFSAMTSGSVLFAGASGILTQDNANFFFDNVNEQLQIQKTAIGVTFSDANGFLAKNTTNAAVNAQQESPPYMMQGSGWKTNATAGPQIVKGAIFLLPVQGAANPSSQIIIQQNTNGGAYQKNLVIGSNSVIMANSNANNTGFYVGNNVDPANPLGTSFIGISLVSAGTGEVRLWAGTSNFLTVYSNATEAFRIPTSGDLLVGTTVDNNAYIQAAASTTTRASLFVPEGTAPTSGINGQIYAKTSDHNLYWRSQSAEVCISCAGSIPTFQQTLTSGSVMTTNNSVNLAGNSFTFATGTVDISGMPAAKNVTSFLSAALTSGITLANTIRLNQTAATSGSAQGEEIYVKTSNATGTIGAAWGGITVVEHAGAGAVTIGRAYQAEVLMTGGGTMNEATGIQTSGVHISGGGTVQNSYGIYVAADDAGAGTIVNSFPIWQDQTNGINVFRSVMRFDNVPAASGTVSVLTQQADNTISKMGIAAASYTPTLTNTTNISTSTLSQAYYTRIGNIVTVTIGGVMTPTTNASTVLTFSLPLTTATGTQNYVGHGVDNMTASWVPGVVSIGSTTTGTFSFVATSSGFSQAFSVTFQYTL